MELLWQSVNNDQKKETKKNNWMNGVRGSLYRTQRMIIIQSEFLGAHESHVQNESRTPSFAAVLDWEL